MIGGFIGKAIGEAFSESKLLPLDNANLTLTGQAVTETSLPPSSTQTRGPLLQDLAGQEAYWKGRS